MASAMLLKAGIVVVGALGGYIIAKIAAKLVSEVEVAEDRPRNGFRNPDNRSTEIPTARNGNRNPDNCSTEVPTTRNRNRNPDTRSTEVPPTSSSSETTARRRTLQKTYAEVSQNHPKVFPPSPSPSPSPIHTSPRQTSGIHKTTAQTLPHDYQPPSSCKPSPFSEVPHRPSSSKPTLYVAPSDPTNPQAKTSYIFQEGTSPVFPIPEDLKDLIKKDVVPRVLKMPLSPSTYKDYFDALLYAEDYYIEFLEDACLL